MHSTSLPLIISFIFSYVYFSNLFTHWYPPPQTVFLSLITFLQYSTITKIMGLYHSMIMYSVTSLIRTRLIRIPDNTNKYLSKFRSLQWFFHSLRLIRTPDKANKFRPSVGVRINEVLLYMMITKLVYLNFLNLLLMRMVKIQKMFSLRRLKVYKVTPQLRILPDLIE